MNLRGFQGQALAGVVSCLRAHRSTILVMPTGTGKTVVMGHAARLARGRVLCVAHREELVHQNATAIERITGLHVGIEMGDDRLGALSMQSLRFVSASVQSLTSKRRKQRSYERFPRDHFGLVMLDECHHAIAPTWGMVTEWFNTAKVLGVTATPLRMDGLAMANTFESVAYEYEINDAIRDGWLVPLKMVQCRLSGIDTSRVRVSAGDFSDASLAEAIEAEKPLQCIVDGVLQHSQGRKTILYIPGVKNAATVTEIFDRRCPGIAAFVHGKTDRDVRRDIMARFKNPSDRLRVLVNVGIATEGFDAPVCSCIAIARLTTSVGLLTQMVGRGTRPLAGTVDPHDQPAARRAAIAASQKKDCIVLEFVARLPRMSVGLVDVLGGTVSDEIMAKVHAMMQDRTERQFGRVQDPAEVIARAKAEVEREAKEKHESLRRKGIVITATWDTLSRDPFDALGIAKPKSTSLFDAPPLREHQLRMLSRAGISIAGLDNKQRRALFRNIIHRIKAGLWTIPQEMTLRSMGVAAASMKFAEASAMIDRIRKSGSSSVGPRTGGARYTTVNRSPA